MEAKTTKMIAAVAVIVMCAAGLVGAGYAYTASTINENNSATSEYVTLSQTGSGAYHFINPNQVIYYNTVNNSTGTTYELDNASTTDVTNYTTIKLGKTFTIEASQVGTIGERACEITFPDGSFSIPTGYYLIFKITNNATPTTLYFNGTAWTGDNHSFTIQYSGSTYYNSDVEIYYGFLTASPPAVAPTLNTLTDVDILFTVTTDGHNPFTVASIAHNNAGNKLNTVTFAVSLNGGSALTVDTDYTVSWKNADGSAIADASAVTIVEGTQYILVITGAGNYAHTTVTEVYVTGAAPAP